MYRLTRTVAVAILLLRSTWPAGAAQGLDTGPVDPRDLSGVWIAQTPGPTVGVGAPSQMTPWAESRFRDHQPTLGPRASLNANDPTVECFPPGLPYVLTVPVPFEFIRSDGRITQLFEYNHTVRRIYTDGRGHPADLHDTEIAQWMGHSIGRWDGDVLVIDTVGFNDRTWLDRLGHPHSTSLHVVERIRRTDRTTLEYRVTIDDPVAYVAPWEGSLRFEQRRDWEILEHNCMAEGAEYAAYRQRAWTPAR